MAFPTNCGARYVAVADSQGGAITRASFEGMTPAVFEAQGMKEVYFDRVIANSAEAVAAGYQEKFLESLLKSRMFAAKGQLARKQVGNESLILPFIYRRQKRHINSNYWQVVTGAVSPGAGSNGLHPGAWDLTVRNNQSKYGTALTSIERYFLPGRYVLVETVDATTKAAISSVFKVITKVNADSGSEARAKITLEPNVTADGWNGYTTALKAPWQPTAGLVLSMANSVSDYESWCHNDPSENNRKLLTYWPQRTRETHRVNSEYLKAFMGGSFASEYWKQFRQLPLAEQRRQQQANAFKSKMNTWFFGQRISELQDVETYDQLPQVVDPLNPDTVIEYKATSIGFEQQLINCGRYSDMAGAKLDLLDLFSVSYDMKRARESSGMTVDRIEWGTNRTNAGRIFQVMNTFFKSYYGYEVTRFMQMNQKLMHDKQVMLNYDVYEIPSEFGGFELVIWHDDYFSDKMLTHTDTDQVNRQNSMWAYDFSDIQIAVTDSNSVQRVHPDPTVDRLYSCIMTATKDTIIMKSEATAPIIEDPLRHYVIKNFKSDCPLLVANPCTGAA